MDVGSIPWSDVVDYGERKMLVGDALDLFVDIIMEMDKVFVEWNRAEADRKRKKNVSANK